MVEAKNMVNIEGLISEINLEYGSYVKDGKTVETIGGYVKVKVQQVVNLGEEPKTLEIPVHMFANKYKKGTTTLNASYENIENIKKNFNSIALAGGEEGADGIRFTSKYTKIQMNEFYGRNGQLVSYPRVVASFASKVKRDEVKYTANFTSEFVVSEILPETVLKDGDMVETGRYTVIGAMPIYGDKVDVVHFTVANPNVISAISTYWSEGDTVEASGVLNFSSKTETYIPEVAFGEAEEKTRTISISELIIKGGSEPKDEGYDIEDIRAGLKERQGRLMASKEKSMSGANVKKAPAAGLDTNLGF